MKKLFLLPMAVFLLGAGLFAQLQQDLLSFVLTEEGADRMIERLETAGCHNLYQALAYLRAHLPADAPAELSAHMDNLLSSLDACPADSEVYTADLADFTPDNTPVGINADGTFVRADFSVHDYDGHEGYGRCAGTELYTYADDADHYIYIGSNITDLGGGVTLETNYHAFAIAWNAASPLPPAIGVNHGRLNFAKVGTAVTSAQTLLLRNTGGGTLSWAATPSAGWIVLDRTSGSGNAKVQVSVNATGLGNGTYTGTISVTDPAATNSPQVVQVSLVVKNAGSSPFGTFETPAAGAVGVTGNVAVTGWVVDDVEVASVKIYRSPLAGEGSARVYIGDANLVEGARPDVEAAYAAYPWSYRSGWGYMMLTNFLPNGGNGTFTIHAVASDREGRSVTLGSKTVTCDNAHATLPFGTIDTPGQGGTTSGSSYVNFGWALTPQPASIPTNGSTINVWVDGVPLGHPTYDQYRADIATLFPGYANSDGAVGYFYLDPTALSEGAHSIAWSVEDSLGRLDGIGSRYFMVEHTAGGVGAGCVGAKNLSPLANEPAISESVDDPQPLRVRRGFAGTEETVYPDRDGVIEITVRSCEPLAIELDPDMGRGEWHSPRKGQNHSVRFAGLERIGDDLRHLPIGARLDPQTGVFTWLPGPGFRGTFALEFLARQGNASVLRQRVAVTVE